MPSFIETEGCLSSHHTRNKKKRLPRFEFIVNDISLAKDCESVLEKIGFSPKFSVRKKHFKIALYDSKEVIRLINKTKEYFLSQKKIEYLKGICTNGIGL